MIPLTKTLILKVKKKNDVVLVMILLFWLIVNYYFGNNHGNFGHHQANSNHHSTQEFPPYKAMLHLLMFMPPTCHVEGLNILYQGNLVWFTKIRQNYIQLWIDGGKATCHKIKHGLILVKDQHPLYGIYGLVGFNDLLFATINSWKAHPQLAISSYKVPRVCQISGRGKEKEEEDWRG